MKTKKYFLILCLSILLSCETGTEHGHFISEDIFQFNHGEWKCTVINDGIKKVPTSVFFDSAAVVALGPIFQKYNLDLQTLTININVLILQKKEQTILIDPGLGKDIGSGEGNLMRKLRKAGIDSTEVDMVIITHGHWDHIGGLATHEGDLYFPNANYIMSEVEWDYWTSEENLENMYETYAQWAREDLPPIKERVDLIKGDEKISGGITAIPIPGHTPGQIALLFSSGGEEMLYISDALHFLFQLAMPGVSPIVDMDPALAAKTREDLLRTAFENNYKVFGFHFDFPGLVSLKSDTSFAWSYDSPEVP